MKTKLVCLLLASGLASGLGASGATPGPAGNFGRNAVWAQSDVNAIDATGLATRGMIFFDGKNYIGATDRFVEAVRSAVQTSSLSEVTRRELQRVLTVSEVTAGAPDAIQKVSSWLTSNMTSPCRGDMMLLLADLLLEKGNAGEARLLYRSIDIDALCPMLRDDYLYHSAYADMVLADYAAARAGFENPELLASEDYGNGARFYLGYISYVDRDYAGALQRWDSVNPYTLPGRMADYYKAQIAYYNGRFDEALRLSRQLLKSTDNVPTMFTAEINRIAGESLYQKGEPAQSIPYLKKYLAEVETPELSTLYILGLASYEEGDYAGAVKSLTPVTAQKSAMGQSAYLYIGQALLRTGDDNGAIMAFNRALSMDIDPVVTENAYYNYAVAKSRGGGVPFASAVTTFEEFLTRYPNSRYADDVAGYIVTGYVTDGNYEAALKSINRIKNPSPAIMAAKQKVLYMLGANLLATDKPAEAVKMLSQGRQLAAYDEQTAYETSLVLGEALYRTGDYDLSAAALLEYLEKAPEKAPNRPVALYDLGYTRMAQKEWGKAQLNFERLVAEPGNLTDITLADSYSRLGDARYYQRNWGGAAEAYSEAYRLNPGGGDYPLFQQAVMQGYNRDYSAKLATLNELLNAFPTSAIVPDALLEKAEAYIQLRQPEKASGVYRELISDYSETAQGRRAYLFLAADYAGNGDIDKAITTYQDLIRIAGTSDEARLADEAVKRLHAERGTLDEYTAFVEQIDGAPTLNAAEAETLAWNAAEHACLGGKGVALLEKYVKDYPSGAYTVKALVYLLENARENDNEGDTYRWASYLVNAYPDNAATEQALVIKAEIDYSRGRGLDALQVWEKLEQKASTTETRNTARMGIMRVARDINDSKKMRAAADALLKSSTLGAEDKTEAAFSRALAMSLDGETEGAITAWKELAGNTNDVYGAKAAVYAAEALNSLERYAESAKLMEDFVNSGTPHTYWLARGFVALSDAYAGQGRQFEAREYIKALKENYPGDETDIFEMIEERLK